VELSKSHTMILVSLFTFIVAPAALCLEEPTSSKAIYNTFSDEEEMTMGRNAAAEVEKVQPILEDDALSAYVEKIGQRIAKDSQRPKLQYHFKIVNTPVMNAFSLPGGYVYANRALLDFAESESELAGVLAHEVGHVVAYHSMNDVARRYLVDRAIYESQKAGLVTDQQVQDVMKQYGGPILLFVDRKFSREEENEADMLGIYNMTRSGWDPNGLVQFLGRLIRVGADQNLVELLLRNHPLPEDRVANLATELKQIKTNARLTKNSTAFVRMKEYLSHLPPAPEPPKEPAKPQ